MRELEQSLAKLMRKLEKLISIVNMRHICFYLNFNIIFFNTETFDVPNFIFYYIDIVLYWNVIVDSKSNSMKYVSILSPIDTTYNKKFVQFEKQAFVWNRVQRFKYLLARRWKHSALKSLLHYCRLLCANVSKDREKHAAILCFVHLFPISGEKLTFRLPLRIYFRWIYTKVYIEICVFSRVLHYPLCRADRSFWMIPFG